MSGKVEIVAKTMYTATAERDGRFWFLRVPDLNVATQARRLDQAEELVRGLIATRLDVDPDSFEVTVRSELAPELSELVVRAVAAKGRAAAAQAEASNAVRGAAKALTEAGLTIRDAGAQLGMTHQRVAQLLADPVQSPSSEALGATVGEGGRTVVVYSPKGRRRTTAREVVAEARLSS